VGVRCLVALCGGRVRDPPPVRSASEGAAEELRQHVARDIARPRQFVIVPELPKTRQGKIFAAWCNVAEGQEVGDAATLADVSVMDLIASQVKAGAAEGW
jgi:hypothetical protein